MKKLILSLLALVVTGVAHAQGMKETDPAFFKTAEAQRIGDQMLIYQRVTGGWPKNIDMAKPMSEAEKAQVKSEYDRRNDSTTDNGATTTQMLFLARLWQATGKKQYAKAFCRGVEYLLSGQYENGGWPQFWPVMRDYQIHITFNDDAMVNTMNLLREIADQKEPFQGKLTSKKLRQRCSKAFDKGVECILKTQIRDANGNLTVWCQQHDRETFLPANARAFELASYCSQESAAIVKLLMLLPNPDERVKQAVHAAMRWFDEHKIEGKRVEVVRDEKERKSTRASSTMPRPVPSGPATTISRTSSRSSATAMAFPASTSKTSVSNAATATAGTTTVPPTSISGIRSGARSTTPPTRLS